LEQRRVRDSCTSTTKMPELRKDAVTGRWVIISTERRKRPSDFRLERPTVIGEQFCPFCTGREQMTPPEVLAFRHNGSGPNSAGWDLRVVPNKFPALQVEGSLDRQGDGLRRRPGHRPGEEIRSGRGLSDQCTGDEHVAVEGQLVRGRRNIEILKMAAGVVADRRRKRHHRARARAKHRAMGSGGEETGRIAAGGLGEVPHHLQHTGCEPPGFISTAERPIAGHLNQIGRVGHREQRAGLSGQVAADEHRLAAHVEVAGRPGGAHQGAQRRLVLGVDVVVAVEVGRDQVDVLDHVERSADITIAAQPVSVDDASAMGIFRFEGNGQIVAFEEKPKRERLEEIGQSIPKGATFGGHSGDKPFIASMGVYVFSRDVLLDAIEQENAADFGRQIIPGALGRYKVNAHLFRGYWADVGTVASFYDANIMLTHAGALAPYESDGLTTFRARPRAVVLVESTDEVVQTVKICHEAGVPFMARGSGTSLSGVPSALTSLGVLPKASASVWAKTFARSMS